MYYLVSEKDIAAFAAKNISLEEGDTLVIFCKDMEKPVFSGKDLMEVISLQRIIPVELQPVASKEEEIFLIGGMAASDKVTLVNIDVSIPVVYKDKVILMNLGERKPAAKRTSRGRKKKAEPVEDGGSE